MTTAHILGFPRIGAQRELKFALEAWWRAPDDPAAAAALADTGRTLRACHWAAQRAAGLDYVTVGDFAWYDQVLTMLAHVGGLPRRFGFDPATLTLAQYCQAARGNAAQAPLEMTKWFDTNYHYLVPEFTPDTTFGPGVDWLFDEVAEARALGHRVKPVLIGPLTLLRLGKARGGLTDVLTLLPGLVAAYGRLLERLRDAGIDWVQIDEPVFALTLDARWLDAAASAYGALAQRAPKILLATYFNDVSRYAACLQALPVAGLHLDLVRAPEQLSRFMAHWPADRVLSAGVVDGRNIWRNDLDASFDALRAAHAALGERLWLAPSCSLLHVPVDLSLETRLDEELTSWLAFAVQKLREVVALKHALQAGREAAAQAFDEAARALATRRASARTTRPTVRRRVAALTDADAHRATPYAQRAVRQRARFGLPLLPTTTIGSFPQTPEIRAARAAYKHRALSHLDYLEAMRAHIRLAIAKQEEYGLDVLVHGEAERNDMVEYFAQLLSGFAVSDNGWVQSYGSRCVKPPIIYGDVEAGEPMTVAWTAYAQGLTDKPVKGMLTGPVTLLQWSFVRDDQPRASTALQLAVALRAEIAALETAGIGMIQVDEPALREGLPLDEREHAAYIDWAVRAFKVACGGADDATQIHTHMCYAEFGDLLPAIAALDADVISIESTRSNMDLLDAFEQFAYENEIGPGVYDIHSPRVPSTEQMAVLLDRALRRIPAERLWVNPDCGLKTRDWDQVDVALSRMVQAACRVRASLAQGCAPA